MDKQAFTEINKLYMGIVRDLETEEQETPEDRNLYLLSFFGLLRGGVPYRITEVKENRSDILSKSKKQGKGKKQNAKQNAKQKQQEEENAEENVRKYRVVNIKIGKVTYTCLEQTLLDMFGKEYVVVRENRISETRQKQADRKKSDDYTLPYVEFEELQKQKKEKTVQKQGEVSEADDRKRIPYIENDHRYQDDEKNEKQYDSFLFNRHSILVTFSNGKPVKYDAVVYPLNMNTSDTIAADIFVIITDEDGRMRCEMSEVSNAGRKSVNAEFDKCTFVVRGEWERGEFVTSIQVLATEDGEYAALEDSVKHIVPTARTSSFYFRYQGKDGTWLNAFPTSLLKNNPSTGMANAIVMIEDGYTRKVYTLENSILNTWFDKAQRDIALYWMGNALRFEMSEISEV